MEQLEAFIVAYKEPDVTQRAINTFRETGGNIRLTVLDNSPEKLKLSGADEHYHFPWNPSLTRVWNWALCLSKSEWTMISNSDVEFKPGWLGRWISEGFQEKGVVHNWFYCFFIHRKAVEQIGWFDERFTDGYWEDVDYVRRLKIAGLPWNDSAFQDLIIHYHDFEGQNHFPRVKNTEWYQKKWGDLKNPNEFDSRDTRTVEEFNWYPLSELNHVAA